MAFGVSRGDRHLKAEQRTIFDAVARGFLFSRGRKKQKQNKGPWGGALRVGIAAFTCPTHGPIPPPTHRRPLLGSLLVGWPLQGRGLPRGNHNGPKEAIASTRHKKSALPRPRPVGHQSTPWPHQTPTKHPRGPAHHPARLWWPWAASGVAKRAKTAPCGFLTLFLSPGCNSDSTRQL